MRTDYRNTCIKVKSLDEFNKAIQFYKSKWYSVWKHSWIIFEWYNPLFSHIVCNDEWNVLRHGNYFWENITDEVFGNNKIPIKCSEEYQHLEAPFWVSIKDLVKNSPNIELQNYFNLLQKKTMSRLRTNIRNEFFNSQEKNITKLVSNVEEKSEDLKSVLRLLLDKLTDGKNIIDMLENAIDDNNKQQTKRLKKQLEEFAIDLDDKLREQLLTIAKKLVK